MEEDRHPLGALAAVGGGIAVAAEDLVQVGGQRMERLGREVEVVVGLIGGVAPFGRPVLALASSHWWSQPAVVWAWWRKSQSSAARASGSSSKSAEVQDVASWAARQERSRPLERSGSSSISPASASCRRW